MKHISIDLGNTLFDRRLPKIPVYQEGVYQLFRPAFGVLSGHKHVGDKISVISYIPLGAEPRIMFNLCHHQIVPYLINSADVHFCYSRKSKGVIAAEIGSTVHIDDRVEVLNAINDTGSILEKILFIEAYDDRENTKPTFEGYHIARNWDEVGAILRSLE
jgi:hypothetical protein